MEPETEPLAEVWKMPKVLALLEFDMNLTVNTFALCCLASHMQSSIVYVLSCHTLDGSTVL